MDKFDKGKRSEIMSKVGSKNTKPEILIRKILHQMGYRFRLHRKDLPGSPDIILTRHKKVILVHGCFWHGHKDCRRSKLPETNRAFWEDKINKNIKRDKLVESELISLGWKVMIIWDCQTNKHNREKLIEAIRNFMNE